MTRPSYVVRRSISLSSYKLVLARISSGKKNNSMAPSKIGGRGISALLA